MSQADTYLQFPLCALAYEKTTDARLNAVLRFGMVDAGRKLWRRVVPDLQKRQIVQWQQDGKLPKGFNSAIALHCATLYGAKSLGVTCHSVKAVIEDHERVQDFVAEFESRHGRNPLVRIKLDWLFKTRDKKGITYREFAVLCAIYSCIGDKLAAQVTQPRIRRCALGYKTSAVMAAELARRADGARPLTVRRLRDTIARLHRTNFFARCTYSRRMTYYSIRGTDAMLRESVKDRHTYALAYRLRQAAKDEDMTAAIKRARAASASPRSNKPRADSC